MMNQRIEYSKSLDTYLQVKNLRTFSVLKRLNFNGQLIWTDQHHHKWTLFFHDGQVVYGTGGIHPIRRWYRHVQTQLPQRDLSYPMLAGQVASALPFPIWSSCWDYQLLYGWLSEETLSQATLQAISHGILVDLLFDILQAGDVHHRLVRQPALPSHLAPIALDEASLLSEVKELWEDWQESGMSQYSPNLAPVVKHPQPIQAEVSPHVFQTLMQLLDGQRSLRDLSAKLGQSTLAIAQALQPYIEAGWISLEPLDDFPPVTKADGPGSTRPTEKPPCIACVDDSPMVCQTMGQIVRAAGYDFLAITEGERAVPTMLAKKPDLIFLDLVMPNTNGYEICSQLRKISRFKETPIIILSGNDGLVDQVRARLLGASDFLSKPIEPIVILSVIRKHLRQLAYV